MKWLSKLALDNFKGDVFRLDDTLIARGCKEAAASPRKRIIYPVQRTQADKVQRLINFLQPGTYIRPHLHPEPHATESVIVHRGAIGFLIFDNDGVVKDSFRLTAGTDACMTDMVPEVWHSFVVLQPDTVVIEFKKGPYDSKTDKRFAEWTPDEQSTEAQIMVKKLTNEF